MVGEKQQIDFRRIALQPGKRAALIGQTGTGKSTLARFLVKDFPHVHAFDEKGELIKKDRWDKMGFVQANNIDEYKELAERHTEDANGKISFTFPRVVYVPAVDELEQLDIYNEFFRLIYDGGNRLFYVDEAYAIVPHGKKMPSYFRAVLTRGRSRDVTGLVATQRPVDVPNIVFSESERKYIFRLVMEGDRKKVESFTGIPAESIADLPDFHFFMADLKGNVERPLKLDL